MSEINYTVDEIAGRKVFKIQLPDGMTTDEIKGWMDKVKTAVANKPIPVAIDLD